MRRPRRISDWLIRSAWLRPVMALLLLLCVGTVQAVDVILPDLNGRDRSLDEFRGQWVLVNFWASWCQPCIEEMPELERFHLAHHEHDAVVIGINMEDSTPEQLKAFLRRQPVSYPVLLAPVDGHTTLGRVLALPTSMLISPEGQLITRHVGIITADKIEQLIEQGEQARQPDRITKNQRSVQ